MSLGPSRRALLVDTNLLLVLIVGTTDRAEVGRFKRTNAYTVDDYDLLLECINEFQSLVVTPNILTEVSNLVGQTDDARRRRFLGALATLAVEVPEHYVESKTLVSDGRFLRLGLADVSVLQVAQEDVTVLTADLQLYLALVSAGIEAINFNHLRSNEFDI
jgi:hypothetical protein